jgi:threonine synthase
MATATRYTGLIEHYRDRMPVTADTRIISLGEGRDPCSARGQPRHHLCLDR